LEENETIRDGASVCRDQRDQREQGDQMDQSRGTPAADVGCRDAAHGSPEQVTCYPCLPDAIAPSLASTPEFARRNSWCHATEANNLLFTKIISVRLK
jgi:hypothetical protein